MHLDLQTSPGKHRIQSVQRGEIKIDGSIYTTNLLITPEEIQTWEIDSIHTLTQKDIVKFFEFKPEVIIIGVGYTPYFLPAKLLSLIQQQHIGVEYMVTSSACKTFNILVNEGRKVLAALIIQ